MVLWTNCKDSNRASLLLCIIMRMELACFKVVGTRVIFVLYSYSYYSWYGRGDQRHPKLQSGLGEVFEPDAELDQVLLLNATSKYVILVSNVAVAAWYGGQTALYVCMKVPRCLGAHSKNNVSVFHSSHIIGSMCTSVNCCERHRQL